MAKFSLALVMAVGFLAGCQQQTATVNLPRPSFDPPTIAQSRVVAPPPVKPVPQTVAPIAGIPGSWKPPVAPRRWQWIVIHHSATPGGGAVAFDRMHKEKGWDELGYHFVIGNGTDTPDGAVEVGGRWTRQKWGAHAKTPDNRYNDFGIGICLVGNFENDRPTGAQMRSLAKLTAYLLQTYKIPPERVLGHRDCKSTECPGRNVNLAEIRRAAQQVLAQSPAQATLTARTDK